MSTQPERRRADFALIARAPCAMAPPAGPSLYRPDSRLRLGGTG